MCVTISVAIFRNVSPGNPTMDKVWSILGGWWIIGLVVGLACWFGSNGLTLLFCAASLVALNEFIRVQRLRYFGPIENVFLVLLVMAHYAFILLGWKNFYFLILPLVTFVYLPFFLLRQRQIDGMVHNLWAAQSGLMLCVFLLSFAAGLVFLNDSATAIRKVDPVVSFLFLFFATELNDVFQFVAGKLFGRAKLIPEISPNKTVAGFWGGVVITALLSLFLAPAMLQLNYWQSVLLGCCLSVSGVSGDLMFSSIKRTVGVKDFSNLIPGHGGVLDRLDSMVFTAPTLYCLLYLFLHSGN
jgi:phosphatidate cytidylyltransferase